MTISRIYTLEMYSLFYYYVKCVSIWPLFYRDEKTNDVCFVPVNSSQIFFGNFLMLWWLWHVFVISIDYDFDWLWVIEIIDDMSLDMSSDLSLFSRVFETPFLFNFTGNVLKTDPFLTFRTFVFLCLEIPLFHEFFRRACIPKSRQSAETGFAGPILFCWRKVPHQDGSRWHHHYQATICQN